MAKFDAMELRGKLLEKKVTLLKTEKPVYKTNCMYRPYQFANAGEFDIRMANKQRLLDGFKHLTNHVVAAKELGVDSTHIGFTVEEWTEDFKLRVAVIDKATTLRQIEKMEETLRTVLTPKQLREIGIADLASAIDEL